MSQEVLWWRKESKWENKSIPIGDFLFSIRELSFIFSFSIMGALISVFVPFTFLKLLIFFAFFAVGYMLSRTPSNTVPWELTLLYAMTGNKPKKIEEKGPQVARENVALIPNVPLAVSGEVKVERNEEIILFVDGKERARTTVSPSSGKYRIYYIPERNEVGVHELELRLKSETLRAMKVEVK
jgi:hypothetical protein